MMKFHKNSEHSQSFQKAPGASCALSQPPRRLYLTHKILEVPQALQLPQKRLQAKGADVLHDSWKLGIFLQK